jgi:hypothetical protein
MFYKYFELLLRIHFYFQLLNFLISIEIVWFQIHQQNQKQSVEHDLYNWSMEYRIE